MQDERKTLGAHVVTDLDQLDNSIDRAFFRGTHDSHDFINGAPFTHAVHEPCPQLGCVHAREGVHGNVLRVFGADAGDR
jgi:hypothetical protein